MPDPNRRVVVITGAGRGLGRSHALEFARSGAAVVVNDLGSGLDGSSTGEDPADAVVAEVRALGSLAIADRSDISEPDGAEAPLRTALDEFGRVDVLVNNAGILRDRMLVNLDIDDWDAVIKVHLRGTFAPLQAFARHWRELAKGGQTPDARIVNTTSPSGLYGNVGQINYGAAKAGIAAMTVIAARELARYGVTVNAIAPAAATRMTELLTTQRAVGPGDFDPGSPDNVSPLVVWLAGPAATGVTGQVFNVRGGHVSVAEGWRAGPAANRDHRWTQTELDVTMPALLAQALGPRDINGSPAPTGRMNQ